MSNELSNELRIELSCGRCGLTKTVTVNLDEGGVFTIPNKFCPNDLNELEREVLRTIPKPEPKPDEPTENQTRTSDTLSKPTRPVDLSKNGADSSKKT